MCSRVKKDQTKKDVHMETTNDVSQSQKADASVENLKKFKLTGEDFDDAKERKGPVSVKRYRSIARGLEIAIEELQMVAACVESLGLDRLTQDGKQQPERAIKLLRGYLWNAKKEILALKEKP